jgi:hypothetical protein
MVNVFSKHYAMYDVHVAPLCLLRLQDPLRITRAASVHRNASSKPDRRKKRFDSPESHSIGLVQSRQSRVMTSKRGAS